MPNSSRNGFGGPGTPLSLDPIYSPERGCVVDYVGTHQHVAVDLYLSVDNRGGLLIRSGEQRFHEGRCTSASRCS